MGMQSADMPCPTTSTVLIIIAGVKFARTYLKKRVVDKGVVKQGISAASATRLKSQGKSCSWQPGRSRRRRRSRS